MTAHRDTILRQFTQQAPGFAASPEMNNDDALRLLVQFSGAGREDTVLDVACGPGLVVSAFAESVKYAIGIDLVPAMIDQARALQAQKQLTNVSWQLGDVLPLPFPDNSFSIVISRYALHHLSDPRGALFEMKRVCTPGGRLVLCDVIVSSNPATAAAYNQMEKWRDPSHVRALSLLELQKMFDEVGLLHRKETFYNVPFELEYLLKGSFPEPGDADRIRHLFVESLNTDGLGVGARCVEGQIHFAYPIAVLCGQKTAEREELVKTS
jgi:SAM-dependent methyltransferase